MADNIDARFEAMARQLKEQDAINKQLMSELDRRASSGLGITGEQLSLILKETSKGSELLASRLKPEVVGGPNFGPFEHPLGSEAMPKPPLVREMWFGGFRLRDQDVNYFEAEALNALSASLGRAQRRLTRDGTWSAEVNDRNDRLTIRVPMKNIDDRADLPSLLQIAMELTSGDKAIDPADVLAELALLRSKVAQLEHPTAPHAAGVRM